MSARTELSPLKQAYLALQDAQTRIAELEGVRAEPIAIVGIGSRLPGAEPNPNAFWSLLRNRGNAVGEGMHERWRAIGAPATETMPDFTRYASLLNRPDLFDAEFFTISPREAAGVDPQQRLVLEVAWEALENAGIAPSSLYGSNTGMFLGLTGSDYSLLQLGTLHREDVNAHYASGCASSIAAGRVSYVLGLRGPALSVDTACSSSLVAVHLACRAIRNGECTMALAGGVNMILATEATRSFSLAGMLSAHGRCAAFAAGADGYVRGEGCGFVVLKPLSRAQADGDRILAVVLGSAINHDGPSAGLTVPSGAAQQSLLRAALASAGLTPDAVGYVEAHGTGTALGDPIEAEALGAVFGSNRARPLPIGSVKTNIGHLESAAGIAGLIKLVLALRHREIPAQLHFDAPSPHIRWDTLGLEVVAQHRAWDAIDGRRIAGVSSFGFSGTNAHVVVADAPARPDLSAPPRPVEILTLSARSESALRDTASAYATRLDGAVDWADVCHTAAVGRTAFAQQLTVRGSDAGELRAGLDAFLASESNPRVVTSRTTQAPRIAFLFTGQGAQYAGMGRDLYASSPRVRGIVDAADAILGDVDGARLGSVMRGEHPDAANLIVQTRFTQPALYVLEYALNEVFRAAGVEPYAVIGHSLGEYVAAAATGVFGFEDGLRLVADRARLMHEVRADGAMLVVAAPEADVAPLLRGYERSVAIAGVNAPSQVTISGDRSAIGEIATACARAGLRTVPLPVSHAFHSPLLDDMAAAFETRAAELAYAAPARAFVSNLTGATIDAVDAAYWRAHTREAVRFADGVRAIDALGCTVLVEIGPKPTLLPLAQTVLGRSDARTFVPTLHAPRRDWDDVARALQQLHAVGVPVDWAGWEDRTPRRIVDAPTYAFQRRRHWFAPSVARAAAPAPGRASAHALLGTRLRTATARAQFEATVSASDPPWLAEHRIAGATVLPGTAFVEIMLAAGAAVDARLRTIADLALVAPVRVDDERTRVVQTVVDDGDAPTVRVFAADDDVAGEQPARFRLQAEARLQRSADDAPDRADLAAIAARCTTVIDGAEHYARLARTGADFGATFRGVRGVRAGDREALGEIDTTVVGDGPSSRPHPAVLDACLQTAASASDAYDESYIPMAFGTFALLADRWPATVFSHARLVGDGDQPKVDLDVYAPDGVALARVRDVAFKKGASFAPAAADVASWFYDVAWKKTPTLDAPAARDAFAVIAGDGALADAIASALRATGRDVALLHPDALDRTLASWNGRGDRVETLVYVPQRTAEAGVRDLLELCRRHAVDGAFRDARLYAITRNLQAVDAGELVDPTDAPVGGLAVTVASEFPQLRCTRIDVDAADVATSAIEIAREIAAGASDDSVAYRRGARYVARLERTPAAARVSASAQPLALRAGRSIDDLQWAPAATAPLGPHDVEIEVYAAALNFRDVVSAVGMIADVLPLGGECAGVVRRTGDAVTRVAEGDAVVALAMGALADRVVTPEGLVVPKPAALSFDAAAAQSMVYLTAQYALVDVAALRAGESVLIHAGAGGVGLASIAMATRIGATVFATAGSERKRAYLRALGVEHVMDSRTLAFADEIRAATGGRGVDVVLNSLAGDFVDAGLSITAPGGRFVEIGKTDIRAAADVQQRHPGIAYAAIDLADRMGDDPYGLSAQLTELLARICAGEMRAVPHRTYPTHRAKDAFRDLGSARHHGKLVLAFDRAADVPVVRGDGAYLITGGMSGLGARVAEWLASRGAGRIVLLGRRAPAPDVAEAIARWRDGGVDVVVRQGDVTNADDVDAAVRDAGPNVRGVIHCANVLDDAPIAELSWPRFATVLGPKGDGAWNLHRATIEKPLDFFVLFSSVAALLGPRGGANYAAANAMLDALAHARRAENLPALSIAWGAWGEIGWAARRSNAAPVAPGFAFMAPDDGIRALEIALHLGGTAHVAVAPIDWRAVGDHAARAERPVPSMFADVVASYGARATPARRGAEPALADVLPAAPQPNRYALAIAQLQDLAANVLGIEEADRIDAERPLKELGMDSILAVDLRNAVARSARRDMPATLLFDYPTIAALAQHVVATLTPAAANGDARAADAAHVTPSAASEADDLLAAIEDLGDDEVDRLLSQRGADVT